MLVSSSNEKAVSHLHRMVSLSSRPLIRQRRAHQAQRRQRTAMSGLGIKIVYASQEQVGPFGFDLFEVAEAIGIADHEGDARRVGSVGGLRDSVVGVLEIKVDELGLVDADSAELEGVFGGDDGADVAGGGGDGGEGEAVVGAGVGDELPLLFFHIISRARQRPRAHNINYDKKFRPQPLPHHSHHSPLRLFRPQQQGRPPRAAAQAQPPKPLRPGR